MIGVDGFDLSGGQKQRLMLARVILKRPEVLILDEATSALDAENERRVIDLIYEENPDMTLICISHRWEAVKACDRTIVIHNGVLVAEGTHGTLLKNCREYIDMFDMETRYAVTE